MMNGTIVLSTNNTGKLRELKKIADSFGMEIITRDDAGVPRDFDVVEDGDTFEENSFKKANEIMKLTGLPTMADDSGLMVDFLDGRPGVLSSRFAGDNCSDLDNCLKLLELMKGVPEEKRTAHFTTVITLVYPDGKKIVAKGECFGHIAEEMRGDKGFGYDPLFIADGLSETFGELGSVIKNRLSHRAKALEELRKLLEV